LSSLLWRAEHFHYFYAEQSSAITSEESKALQLLPLLPFLLERAGHCHLCLREITAISFVESRQALPSLLERAEPLPLLVEKEMLFFSLGSLGKRHRLGLAMF
jgi:hypothetical protein